MQTLII